MKRTKLAFVHSLIALILCASMFVGTTFAWFTDSVTSANNIIQSGTLDVELEWKDETDDEWAKVTDSEEPIFTYTLWEPGYTQVKYVRISNAGNLAFKFRLNIVPNEDLTKAEANLADVIDVYLFPGVQTLGREDIAAADTYHVGTLTELMTNSTGAANGTMEPSTNQEYTLVLKMQESAGNEYMNQSVGNGFSLQLLATQYTYEEDSFGSDYDTDATYRPEDIKFTATTSVADKVNENNELTEEITVGDPDGIYIVFPEGVMLASDAEGAGLSVETLPGTSANIELGSGESMVPMEIKAPGVSEDNTVPMQITIPALMAKNLNFGNAKMYHVEDGETVQMTQVASLEKLDEHNEFYYDPATGDVVLSVATFSEYVAVTDNLNPWNGNFNIDWYTENPDADSFTIDSADELAGFGAIVDGGYHNEDGEWVQLTPDAFEGKTVKLGNDIDLGGTISFNPIGCGYATETNVTNSNSVKGCPFKGTFDGGIYDENGEVTGTYTISNLYQNGWELGLSYCNLGGGLFASIADGTVKNLTISNANIVMECVEMGVLVGLSQGACTYENINIYGCKIANYQRATGGLIGEISAIDSTQENPEETTINHVNIDPTTVVGSLWGDFDTPVGGVIGARWDDDDTTKVTMQNVNVACELDVYNDVTSTYQWYAYRRAGMLIGNTDTPPANGKDSSTATAEFLKCPTDENGNDTVIVVYGDWVNYHYCQFTDCNSNWPWVRVEAGEHNAAYSNPRWGQPWSSVDESGNKTYITDSLHTHQDGDDHLVLIPFNQLYGGGQGVYGQTTHDGVTIGAYTVTYIDQGEVIDLDFPASSEYTIKEKYQVNEKIFETWVDANNNEFEAGGKIELSASLTLFPKWAGEYTVRCLDMNGNIAYYAFYTSVSTDDEKQVIVDNIAAILATIQSEVDATGKVIQAVWDGYESGITVDNLAGDLVLRAEPKLTGTSITLTPNHEDNPTSFSVTDVVPDETNTIITIPAYVGTVPVEAIKAGAFAEFDNLRDVYIPNTITSIGENAFVDTNGDYETIQIYYDGTKEDWDKISKPIAEGVRERGTGWDSYIGDGSIIVCSDGYYLLNNDVPVIGNIAFDKNWEWHPHAYGDSCVEACP